ncbi:MAG: hypothetical protein ACYC5K_05920 [Saccharofermentanales bacterium]
MIQLFIIVSMLVFIGLTLIYILDLRDSHREECREIRKLRRRYASGALSDASSASGRPYRTGSRHCGLPQESCSADKDSNRKYTFNEFFNVGEQCA